MVYTNIVLKNLEKEFEIAAEDVEFDKEDGIESNINDFVDFLGLVFQFYQNHKKGQVDKVEFEDGMTTIRKFVGLFENTEIADKTNARAVDYLYSL